MSKKLKILHICVSRTSNLGDIAIIREQRKLLKKHSPNCEIIPYDIFLMREDSILNFFRFIVRCDLIIIGGGGIVSRFFWPFRNIFLRIIKILRKPIYFYSIGVGLPKGVDLFELDYNNISAWLKAAKWVSVRDDVTQLALGELGISSKVLGDPVLFRYDEIQPIRENNLIGINIANHGWSDFPYIVEKILVPLGAKLRKLNDSGCKFIYIAHHEKEKSVYNYLKNSIDIDWVYDSVDSLHAAYLRVDFQISMMLHSTIFSVVTNTPFFCISYDEKNMAFLNQMGLGSLDVDLEGLDGLDIEQAILDAKKVFYQSEASRKSIINSLISKQEEYVKCVLSDF